MNHHYLWNLLQCLQIARKKLGIHVTISREFYVNLRSNCIYSKVPNTQRESDKTVKIVLLSLPLNHSLYIASTVIYIHLSKYNKMKTTHYKYIYIYSTSIIINTNFFSIYIYFQSLSANKII